MRESSDSHSRRFEELRRKFVADSFELPDDVDEALKAKWRRPSLKRALVDSITKAAVEHALTSRVGEDGLEWDVLRPAYDVVHSLQFGLTEHALDVDWQDNLNFWKLDSDPIRKIKEGSAPPMDRAEVEVAATKYLELPYRSRLLDRTLVEVLVALEIYAYGSLMVGPRGLPFIAGALLPDPSPLRQPHAFVSFVLGSLFNAVLFLGVAYLVQGYIYSSSAKLGWVTLALVVVFLFFLVVSMIALPFSWRRQMQARNEARALLRAMMHTYSELVSSGVLSAEHIRRSAQKAADSGVVWPGPLFVLLDDIVCRDGTL